MVALPSEALHTLQDNVIVEIWAQEQCALNVINDQKVKNAQIFVEETSVIDLLKKITDKNECTTIVVVEACQTILELNIPKDAPVDARI